MRIIKTIGLFFLAKSLYAGSYRAWAIFFNGMIYHCYETVENYESKTSSILRYNDMFYNVMFIIYTSYYYPISRNYGLKAIINFFALCLLHSIIKNRRTKCISILQEFAHVLMIQLPLFKGLELSLDITPTFSCIV